jgi:FkbM family methyltransferase
VYARFYNRGALKSFLKRSLAPGSTYVDIGANVGFFTLFAADLVGPNGRVFAFEPVPEIHEALVRSARANGFEQLVAYQVALSNREDHLSFYRAKDGTASSLVAEAPGEEGRYERQIQVEVTTLDRMVRSGQLDRLDVKLIKIDVEGEEARTVGGMLESLPTLGYPSIWCEVRGPKGSTRAPNTYPAVRDQLASLGYKPFRWDGERVPLTDADVVFRTDVLFEHVPE